MELKLYFYIILFYVQWYGIKESQIEHCNLYELPHLTIIWKKRNKWLLICFVNKNPVGLEKQINSVWNLKKCVG